ETLKAEISQKEEEVRTKETYLASKMEELRMREQGIIEEDIEAREEERAFEIKQEKVKTGTPRLDDLLLGGIPFGSNVSVYGPPFIGKEVVVNGFVAEGLKKGVPAIWVITDKTPDDIRDEMQYVVPGYEEYENLGLVHYIDAYSKGMGAATDDSYATYIDDPTDQAAILEAVDQVATELMKEHKTYRLAFRSISTLMAYLDPASTFRFLQPFAGRRKRDKAVTLYVIEKGMHGEQDIQMLGSLMDGMVDFKVEQLKTYLSVKGISDAQSRAWIQYMYSKQGISIGSFTLDHIR
ncbi:MAG: RAD55 family ATPase, partial [Thermoplasmata archaeon]